MTFSLIDGHPFEIALLQGGCGGGGGNEGGGGRGGGGGGALVSNGWPLIKEKVI